MKAVEEVCFLDIISGMNLTSSSMDSKEALKYINIVFKNFVTSRLLSGMCKKNKSRVYRKLKETLSARTICPVWGV